MRTHGDSHQFWNSKSSVLHTMKAVIFHQPGCQVKMQFLFKVAISKTTFGENWLCLKADASCAVIPTSLKYFSSSSCKTLSSLDTCHENSKMWSKFLFKMTFLSKIPVVGFKLKLSRRLAFSRDLNKAFDNRISSLFSLEFLCSSIILSYKTFILVSM